MGRTAVCCACPLAAFGFSGVDVLCAVYAGDTAGVLTGLGCIAFHVVSLGLASSWKQLAEQSVKSYLINMAKENAKTGCSKTFAKELGKNLVQGVTQDIVKGASLEVRKVTITTIGQQGALHSIASGLTSESLGKGVLSEGIRRIVTGSGSNVAKNAGERMAQEVAKRSLTQTIINQLKLEAGKAVADCALKMIQKYWC